MRIPFNDQGMTFDDISSPDHVQQFVQSHLISLLYDNRLKDHPDRYDPREHYSKEFNKLLGMRMTFKFAEMEQNTQEHYSESIPLIRQTNYDGRTGDNLDYIDKQVYTPTNTSYSSSGGYNNKGGLIFYFEDYLTFEEAELRYSSMKPETLFSTNFVAFTAEIIFYNENYQTGSIINLEFLSDNAGNIKPVVSTYLFHVFYLDSNYHQQSTFWIVVLYGISVFYTIVLLYFCYKEIKNYISKLKSTCSSGINMFEFGDLLSVVFIILNITWNVFFMLCIMFPPEIKISNLNEDDFQSLVDFSVLLYIYLLLACFTIIFMCIIVIISISVVFPIFLSVYYVSWLFNCRLSEQGFLTCLPTWSVSSESCWGQLMSLLFIMDLSMKQILES